MSEDLLQVVCAVIVDTYPYVGPDTRYLLAQRSTHVAYPYEWEFPGGKVQPHEVLTTALVREIMEELDVPLDAFGEGADHRFDPPIVQKPFHMHYAIAALKRTPKITEANLGYGWFTDEEAAALTLTPATKWLIHELLRIKPGEDARWVRRIKTLEDRLNKITAVAQGR